MPGEKINLDVKGETRKRVQEIKSALIDVITEKSLKYKDTITYEELNSALIQVLSNLNEEQIIELNKQRLKSLTD